MNFFIDLEATQYAHEMISIGAITETGEKFYSLMKPRKIKDTTKLITELTGITKDSLETCNSSNKVLEEFYNWVYNLSPANNNFYFYGNYDKTILKSTQNNPNLGMKAIAILLLMQSNFIDYSLEIKKYYDLAMPVKLSKVYNYFYPNTSYNQHNALADACALYDIYTAMLAEPDPNENPFPDYKKQGAPIGKVYATTPDGKELGFKNLIEASNWLTVEIRRLGAKPKNQTIYRNLKKAIRNKTPYWNGYAWRIEND